MENIVKFLPARMKKDGSVSNYKDAKAINNLVGYCWNDEMEKGVMRTACFGGNYLDLTDRRKAIKQIKKAQKIYSKSSGRRMCHYVLSFDSKIRNAEALKMIADDVLDNFFSEYQTLYAVHVNTDNLHIHFVLNPVSIETGKKLSLRHREFWEMKTAIEVLAIRDLIEQGVIIGMDINFCNRISIEELIS